MGQEFAGRPSQHLGAQEIYGVGAIYVVTSNLLMIFLPRAFLKDFNRNSNDINDDDDEGGNPHKSCPIPEPVIRQGGFGLRV